MTRAPVARVAMGKQKILGVFCVVLSLYYFFKRYGNTGNPFKTRARTHSPGARPDGTRRHHWLRFHHIVVWANRSIIKFVGLPHSIQLVIREERTCRYFRLGIPAPIHASTHGLIKFPSGYVDMG